MPQHQEPVRSRLTEENLRLHSTAYTISQMDPSAEAYWAKPIPRKVDSHNDYEESEDGEARMRQLALNRAASLEALQAYGGCFTAGFLAMQQPIPWKPAKTSRMKDLWEDFENIDIRALAANVTVETGSVTTASNTSPDRSGSPRPDSDTLSGVDVNELKTKKRWSWKSISKKMRSS